MSKPKRELLRNVVTVATVGMSTCLNGACDPVPTPTRLVCDEVDEGQSLYAEATLVGTTMTVKITNGDFNATWEKGSVEITKPVNVTADASPSVGDYDVSVSVELTSEMITTGGFTFSGRLSTGAGKFCDVNKDFTFTIAGAAVTIAQALPRPSLPLSRREEAQILIAGRDGHEVDLAARSVAGRLSWSVTGGEISERGPGEVRWRLPGAPGLYQAELVVDQGQDGVSIDTLTLEVT